MTFSIKGVGLMQELVKETVGSKQIMTKKRSEEMFGAVTRRRGEDSGSSQVLDWV